MQCQSDGDCSVVEVDQCHEAFCAANGTCQVRNRPDGTTCDDANPCTDNDQCTNGVCAGTPIGGCVLCDQDSDCSTVSVTQCEEAFCSSNGTCGIRVREGAGCNDGNPCTENDRCTAAGVCVGTQIAGCVLCADASDCPTPPNQCQRAVCTSNGTCAVENRPNGTACNDNNPCTENDDCQNGVCLGTSIPGCLVCDTDADCSSVRVGECEEAFCTQAGTCAVRNKANGTACEDANPCTENDQCTNGVCAGTPIAGCVLCSTAADCPTPPNQCQQAVCSSNGTCGVENRQNGTACDDQNPCTENDQCTDGICAGTQITGCVRCSTDNDCSTLTVGQCEEAFCTAAGTCAVRARPNGITCNDANPCTENDQCVAGVCQGTQIAGCTLCSTAADCPTPPNQCQQAVCSSNGTCGVVNRPSGTSCDDQNPCTENDQCNGSGVCAGTPIAGCLTCSQASDCPTPTNQCQQAACTGGVCTVVNKTNGTACDLQPCLTGETCLDGVCQGGTSTCTGGNVCCAAGTSRPGQCRGGLGFACTQNNQCCNRCQNGFCT